MKKKIIFLGGVGSPTTFGGELTKNKEIISRLKELGYDTIVIDSFNSRKNKMKLIMVLCRFFINVTMHPKATIIFSTSFGNTYPILKILKVLPLKLHIVDWVIGGNLAERIAEGKYLPKYLKMIDLFIVEGNNMKKRMVDLGFNNVWYEPNFKTIGTLPKVRKVDDGKIHFMFLSRIMPDKGCRYILQSVYALNKKGLANKFEVDFFGNVADEYRQEFETAVANSANVNYLGSLNLQDERTYEVLAKYHYMLFPTYWIGEGFPGVVIDAYKAGVPIIGSDWNLNPEFIKDGITGILVPTNSVEKLTEVMENAIGNKYDCAAMSANCQSEVWKYDSGNVINANLLGVITNVKLWGNETETECIS